MSLRLEGSSRSGAVSGGPELSDGAAEVAEGKLDRYQMIIEREPSEEARDRGEQVGKLYSDSLMGDERKRIRELVLAPKGDARVETGGNHSEHLYLPQLEAAMARTLDQLGLDEAGGKGDSIGDLIGRAREQALTGPRELALWERIGARLVRASAPKQVDEWFGRGAFSNGEYQSSDLPLWSRLGERIVLQTQMAKVALGLGDAKEQRSRAEAVGRQVDQYLQNQDLDPFFRKELERFRDTMDSFGETFTAKDGSKSEVEAIGELEFDSAGNEVNEGSEVDDVIEAVEESEDVRVYEPEEPRARVNLTERELERQRRILGLSEPKNEQEAKRAAKLKEYRSRLDDIYVAAADQRGGYDAGLIDYLQEVGEKMCERYAPLRRDARKEYLRGDNRAYEKAALRNFLETLPNQMARGMDVGHRGVTGGFGQYIDRVASHWEVFGWSGLAKTIVPKVKWLRWLPGMKKWQEKCRESEMEMMWVRERVIETFTYAAKKSKAEEGAGAQELRRAKDMANFLRMHAEELELTQLVEQQAVYPLYQVEVGSEQGVEGMMLEVRASNEEDAREYLVPERDTLRKTMGLEVGDAEIVVREVEPEVRQDTEEDMVLPIYELDMTTRSGARLEGVRIAADSKEEAIATAKKKHKAVAVSVRGDDNPVEYFPHKSGRRWGQFFRSLFRIGSK